MKKKSKRIATRIKEEDRSNFSKSLQLEYLFDFGVDFSNRCIQVTDGIEYPLFDFVDAAMTEMEAHSDEPITIKINSYGGSIYEMFAIVGRIKKSNCKIITEGYGSIMSASCLILVCGTVRRISKYAWFMWHEASIEVPFQKLSTIQSDIEQLEKEELMGCTLMAEFSNKDVSFWMDAGKMLDAYFTPTDLLEMGVVDEIF